jgi:hypothetical protein
VRKNLIIGGLVVWNLILMAVLIFVWVGSRRTQTHRAPNSTSTMSEANLVTGEQNFTYKTGERLVGDKAPPIVDRNLTIAATFDTQDKSGVIVAHGGLAQGYALYVQDGRLFFVVRRSNALTTVDGGKVTAGRHTLKATSSKTGELSVALDGKAPATGQAAGGIMTEPVDGLDVGGDRGAPVGLYEVPNDFGGTIDFVSLKTTP